MQKNVTSCRRKGYPNYPPELKQQFIVAYCERGVSISKLAIESGINANLYNTQRLLSASVSVVNGTLRLNGTVSEKLLTLLIQELKR